jgi:hypothetical protein
MKVKELVEMYEKNPRIDIAKKLEVQEYVSISLKRELAKLVLENCTSVVDGEIHIDSVERYILFTISVIGMHTNLEFSSEDGESNSVDDYDMLCESGLLVKIIETFKDDYASCQEILNMMTADKLQENMTIEKKFYKFLDEVQNIIGVTINGLVDKLNLDSLDLSQLDQGDLLKLYETIKDK